MAATGTFSVGGLASGLDTNSIIDQLVKLESSSITDAQKRQAAYRSQISALGDLTSKMSALSTAAAGLKSTGALALSQQGTAAGFTATPAASAIAGRYAIKVDSLAQAAKARSAQFGSASDLVTAGTVSFSINGTNTDVTLTDGMTLAQAAKAINDSGAAVNATVLESNGQAFLSVTAKNTGFTPGQPAASALTITENSNGNTGQPLGLAITQAATNAKFSVDGLPFERASNVVDDALPGVSLNFKQVTAAPEDLVLATDVSSTATNLQKFISAYNDVAKVLNQNLNIGQDIDRTKTLGGDSALRGLQNQLAGIITSIANPASSVRSLADLGIKSSQDGTLTLDQARLSKAIGTDSASVNALFQATGAIGDKLKDLVKTYTDGSTGIFTNKSKSFDKSVKQLDDRIASLQLRVDAYKSKLVAQFSAMENVVASFKSIGNYLTSQEAKSTSK
ncbi:MAG: flagellar filament capping protein FliD [Myxococcaceae bacterium]